MHEQYSKSENIPSEMKKAIITLLPKPDKLLDQLENLRRGVSLINSLPKVADKIILNRVQDLQIIPAEQF